MKTKSLYLTVIAAILFTAGSITFTGCDNASNKKSIEHRHEATEAEHNHDMDDGHEHERDMAEAHYQCPMKCEEDKTYDKPGNCPVCKMELKEVNTDIADAHFQCPMKCEGEKTYAEAGNCPVCKMELKEVGEHQHE